MNKKQIWYAIFWILILVLALRYFPKAGYGLAAITLLVLLLKLKK
jgi:hypothetical protein